jgi:hypothetical protein
MPRKAREIPWLGWRDDRAYVFWYDARTRRTNKLSLGTTDAAVYPATLARINSLVPAIETIERVAASSPH